MAGRFLLENPVPPHSCHLPSPIDSKLNSIWLCDCGKLHKCVIDARQYAYSATRIWVEISAEQAHQEILADQAHRLRLSEIELQNQQPS